MSLPCHPNPPASQLYYWSQAWQVNELAADAQLASGDTHEFENSADAIRWLMDVDD